MSYIGRGVDAISNVEKLDNITFDGSATYALTKSSAAFTPVGANNILISIDGVIQQGNFSVSTTNIVFDWSPTSSNTCDFILHYGTGVLNVPADGSIVAAKMAANSVDSDAYVDASIDNAHLADNAVDTAEIADDAVTLAKMDGLARGKIIYGDASGNPAALTVGSNTQVLKSDGTDISWGAAASTYDATPAFWAYLGSDQTVTNEATTTIICGTETFDTDSAYNASNGVFTVPSGEGGTYLFTFSLAFSNTFDDDDRIMVKLLFNGGTGHPGNKALHQQLLLTSTYVYMGNLSVTLPLAAGDTVALAVENFDDAGTNTASATHTYFAGCKLHNTNS